MESFKVVLKNNRLKQYSLLAKLIFLFQSFFFIYIILKTSFSIITVSGILITIAALVFEFTKYKRDFHFSRNLFYVLLAIDWLFFQNYWMAIALILLLLFDIITSKEIAVYFLPDKIILASFPERSFGWDELDNVILKDGILSIDLNNNQLIQGEVAGDSLGINENQFNAFCHLLTVKYGPEKG